MMALSFVITEEAIQFVLPLKDQNVSTIPGRATFECEVNIADASAEWYFNDRAIRRGMKYDIIADGKTHRLVAKDVEEVDCGEFTVAIKGAKSSANLNVQGQLMSLSLFYWVYW